MTTILFIDADFAGQSTLIGRLTAEGYAVICAGSIKEARHIIYRTPLNAVVMERVLPDGSGLDFIVEVKLMSHVPVIFFTALGSVEDICAGLHAGANDYMIKPLDSALFAVRLAAVLDTYQAAKTELLLPPIRLNMLRQLAFIGEKDLLLTPKEFALLWMLAQNRGQVLTRSELSLSIWGSVVDIGNTLDKNVSRLKKKLCQATDRVIIDTSYSSGYTLTIV
jgi:DNA-binding response OmpR family regulator